MKGGLWFATLLIAVSGSALTAETSPLSREDRKLLEWFNTLGYAGNLAIDPLVRITVLEDKVVDRRDAGGPQLGFLLSEQGGRFKVLLLSLTTRSFPKSDVRMERVELADFAREVVAGNDGDSVADLESKDIFVLAHACADAGLEQLAHDMIVKARAASREPDHFQEALAYDFAFWDLFNTLTDYRLGAPRAEVRDRLKRLVNNFPHFDEGIELARDTQQTLSRMVDEDRRLAKRTSPKTALEGEARIRELIFSLRDEAGFQFSQPGSVEFLGPFSAPTSPANQLLAAGYAAVPQLIEALENTRLTRGVYYRTSPRYVVTIGECAAQILQRISGESFYLIDSRGRFNPKATKARAEAWWARHSRQLQPATGLRAR